MEPVKANAPEVLSASTLIGDKVVSATGEDLGKLEEIMIDLDQGKIAYAVLSFGGILGLGGKLFAIPWNAFRLNPDAKQFVLNVEKERLKNAPGFDKDKWPKGPTHEWLAEVYTFYGYQPYWD